MILSSKKTILLIGILLLSFRYYYADISNGSLQVTTYDAFGYYIYLPAILKYSDYKELKWIEDIDDEYKVFGGALYQANKTNNGNYVFKYYGGIAMMQLPFYLIGDIAAKISEYPADGFSFPYQFALVFAALFYSILGLILLRWLMLQYYDDKIVSLTLIMIALATNAPQYMCIDSGQSHAYIFFLYSLLLVLTHLWHQEPKLKLAFLIGATCGLATVCRPTELISLFIPLLWGFGKDGTLKSKWTFLGQNKKHIWLAILGGFLLLLPQIIYWRLASGLFIYDVGSKWVFLNPFFRVLFGWEKGWFVYTPITVFFIASLFFIWKRSFKRSIWVFTFLNIWIITSWYDWRYGGSYSARALVQSYPVFALAIGGALQKFYVGKYRYVVNAILLYLVLLNGVQLFQYNESILHYDHMNKKYYQAIYLNPKPSPLDYSLLDTDIHLDNPKQFKSSIIYQSDSLVHHNHILLEALPISRESFNYHLMTNLKLKMINGYWDSKIKLMIKSGDSILEEQGFRLTRPQAIANEFNEYAFYSKVPKDCRNCFVEIIIDNPIEIKCQTEMISLKSFKP